MGEQRWRATPGVWRRYSSPLWVISVSHPFIFHFCLCLLDSVLFSDETFTCIALYPRVWRYSLGSFGDTPERFLCLSVLLLSLFMALRLDEKIHFHQSTKSSKTANLQPDFKTSWRITGEKKCHGNNSGLPRNLSSLWRLHHSNVIRSIQSKALSVSDLSPPFCLQWSVHIRKSLNLCLNFRSGFLDRWTLHE